MAQFDSDMRVQFLETARRATSSLYVPSSGWIDAGLYDRIVFLLGITSQSGQVELFVRQSQSADGSNSKYMTGANGSMILGTMAWPATGPQIGSVELVSSKLDLSGYRYLQFVATFSLPQWVSVMALLYPKERPAAQPAAYVEAVVMAG